MTPYILFAAGIALVFIPLAFRRKKPPCPPAPPGEIVTGNVVIR